MKKKIKKIFRRTFLSILLVSGFFLVFLIIFYFFSPLNKFNKKFFKKIPYPIAVINQNKIITTKNLLSNSESLEKFYNSQDFSKIGMRVDFETEEGLERLKIKEKEIFNKLIENEIIEIIAESKGIHISKKEAGKELVTKAQEAGSTENLALSLKKLYNWSLGDFRDKVVIPRLYLGKLIEYYEKENIENISTDSQIKKAYQELEKGISFKEVVSSYSQGETAQNGGELGWFKKKYLSTNISEKAYSMQPGNFSEIIKSPLGSHIIYLEEIREEAGVKEVKLKQIFTPEGSFLDWLNNEKGKISIKVFSKDYFWNKEALEIKFSDSALEINEKKIRNNSNGDPSIY